MISGAAGPPARALAFPFPDGVGGWSQQPWKVACFPSLISQGEESRATQEEPTQLDTVRKAPGTQPKCHRELLAEGEGPALQSGRDLAAPRGWDMGAPSGPCPSVFLPPPLRLL